MGDNPSDHELLIEHSVKIDHLCALIKKVDKTIERYTEKLDTRCAFTGSAIASTHKEIFEKVDKKMDSATFRWMIGLLVLGMITVAGIAGSALTNSYVNHDAVLRLEDILTAGEEIIE